MRPRDALCVSVRLRAAGSGCLRVRSVSAWNAAPTQTGGDGGARGGAESAAGRSPGRGGLGRWSPGAPGVARGRRVQLPGQSAWRGRRPLRPLGLARGRRHSGHSMEQVSGCRIRARVKTRAAGAVTRRGWARRERGPDHEGGVRAWELGAGLSWSRGMGPSDTELVHTCTRRALGALPHR